MVLAPPTAPPTQEMYVECEPVEDGDRQVEDYLEFEPGQGAQDGPTSMYEDMQASEGHDVEQDLYEEPGGCGLMVGGYLGLSRSILC